MKLMKQDNQEQAKLTWDEVILRGICILSGTVIAGALLYLVITRYVFDWSSKGLHTYALIAALWFYMMGALLASRSRDHLSVDILSHQLRDSRFREVQQLLVALLKLVIIVCFAYWTYRMFLWGARFSTTMPSSNIPTWVPQMAIAINAVGSLLYALRDVYRAWVNIRQQGEVHAR